MAEFDVFNRYIGRRRMPFRSCSECFSFLRCELPPFSGKDELLKADRRIGTGSLAHRELVSEQEVVERKSGSCLLGCKHR